MKTKDVPAIIMLLAGCIYCLFGILYQIPLTDFLKNLLLVLVIFWILGGIIKMILDKFMIKFEDNEEVEELGDSDEEGIQKTDETSEDMDVEEESFDEDE